VTTVQAERPAMLERGLPGIRYARLSDADLVCRANGGDRRALDALVERYSGRVSRLTAQILGDIEDARDAAQESLLKVSLRLRQFRGECQFSTWLHRLVVNTCRDLAERQRLRRSENLDLVADRPVDHDDDPSRMALIGDLRRELVGALARLTAEQRRVLLLRDTLDLSYEEIGRIVRIPVGTAKSYVHRGRQNLRRRLQEYSAA
jgi:RNA polymerase sigma-70 factor (ECF subfamily)